MQGLSRVYLQKSAWVGEFLKHEKEQTELVQEDSDSDLPLPPSCYHVTYLAAESSFAPQPGPVTQTSSALSLFPSFGLPPSTQKPASASSPVSQRKHGIGVGLKLANVPQPSKRDVIKQRVEASIKKELNELKMQRDGENISEVLRSSSTSTSSFVTSSFSSGDLANHVAKLIVVEDELPDRESLTHLGQWPLTKQASKDNEPTVLASGIRASSMAIPARRAVELKAAVERNYVSSLVAFSIAALVKDLPNERRKMTGVVDEVMQSIIQELHRQGSWNDNVLYSISTEELHELRLCLYDPVGVTEAGLRSIGAARYLEVLELAVEMPFHKGVMAGILEGCSNLRVLRLHDLVVLPSIFDEIADHGGNLQTLVFKGLKQPLRLGRLVSSCKNLSRLVIRGCTIAPGDSVIDSFSLRVLKVNQGTLTKIVFKECPQLESIKLIDARCNSEPALVFMTEETNVKSLVYRKCRTMPMDFKSLGLGSCPLLERLELCEGQGHDAKGFTGIDWSDWLSNLHSACPSLQSLTLISGSMPLLPPLPRFMALKTLCIRNFSLFTQLASVKATILDPFPSMNKEAAQKRDEDIKAGLESLRLPQLENLEIAANGVALGFSIPALFNILPQTIKRIWLGPCSYSEVEGPEPAVLSGLAELHLHLMQASSINPKRFGLLLSALPALNRLHINSDETPKTGNSGFSAFHGYGTSRSSWVPLSDSSKLQSPQAELSVECKCLEELWLEGVILGGEISGLLRGAPKLMAVRIERMDAKELDFSENHRLSHLSLRESKLALGDLKSLHNVRKLDLSSCTFGASFIEHLVTSLPKAAPYLEELTLDMNDVPSKTKWPGAMQFPRMRILTMKSFCWNNQGIATILEGCPNLEALRLVEAPHFTFDGTPAAVFATPVEALRWDTEFQLPFPLELPNLKYLELHSQAITDMLFNEIIVTAPKLEMVHATYCKGLVKPKIIHKRMRELNLGMSSNFGATAKSELEKLVLEWNTRALIQCPCLQVLELGYTSVDDEFVSALLEANRALQVVLLSDCANLRNPLVHSPSLRTLVLPRTLNVATCGFHVKCEALHTLVLAGCMLSDAVIERLVTHNPGLTCLDLSAVKGEETSPLDSPPFNRATGLKKLCVSQSSMKHLDISECDLEVLVGLQSSLLSVSVSGPLKQLILENCANLESIQGIMPNLQTISVSNSPSLQNFSIKSATLKSLTLKDNKLSDESLAFVVANCTAIETLHVSGCKRLVDVKLCSDSLRVVDIAQCKTVRALRVDAASLDKITLMHIDSIEILHLRCPQLPDFQVPTADTLTSLHIESYKILSLEIRKALKDLKLKLPSLLSLSLGSLDIPSHQYEEIFANTPAVRMLTMEGTSASLIELRLALPLLELLVIEPAVTSFRLQRLSIGQCPKLKAMKMPSHFMMRSILDPLMINKTPGCLSHLLELSISASLSLDSDALRLIALSSPNLRVLEISSCVLLDDGAVSSLSDHAKKLEILRCSNCDLVAPSLHLPELKLLDLGENPRLVDPSIKSASLESLILDSAPISDRSLARIAGTCPQLRMLWLKNCDIQDSADTIWEHGFENVESIDFTDGRIGQNTVSQLLGSMQSVVHIQGQRAKGFASLTFKESDQFEKLEIIVLTGCSDLETFVMDRTSSTSMDLYLSDCARLKSVRLDYAGVIDVWLSGCMTLTQAELRCPNLLTLNFHHEVLGMQKLHKWLLELLPQCPRLEIVSCNLASVLSTEELQQLSALASARCIFT